MLGVGFFIWLLVYLAVKTVLSNNIYESETIEPLTLHPANLKLYLLVDSLLGFDGFIFKSNVPRL